MTSSGIPPGSILRAFLLLVAAVPALARVGLDRTPFRDIPATDPARAVIQTVLDTPFYSMRLGFSTGAWNDGGYEGAWERARRYFPDLAYYVRPGTYFMTHGFAPDGRLFMEIHESAYLSLCIENWRTFRAETVVGEYGRMLGEGDGGEPARFREKVGRLETFFRDEPAHADLQRILGRSLYGRFLEELREENFHMLAAGLMHEGLHAGMTDALVARIQAEFRSGRRTVQWDELRAFMAEAGYHGAFSEWASGDIVEGWSRIEDLLGKLESLRKRPRLRPGRDRSRFERIRAEAWVFAALIRLRMREIWQSARRMQGLLESFRSDYIRPDGPVDISGRLGRLVDDMGAFGTAAGEAIRTTEMALRRLEEILDQWSDWAVGRRPFPPPVTDSKGLTKQARAVSWPAPPAERIATLMKKAEAALEEEGRISSIEGPRVPTSSRPPRCEEVFARE